VGDTVNAAARIESENKGLGTEVLVSAATHAAVPPAERAGLGLAAVPVSVSVKGKDVALSALSYKANAFEAKIDSVRLEPDGDAGADPFKAGWRFVGSNSDGQQHRVEIFVRLLDSSGKQIDTFSKSFFLSAGAHDQVCVVPMSVKAEHWKAAKSARNSPTARR